ncbi:MULTISPECIES: beta-ketoacyl-ACP synthase III [unclassified Streptomyces]|uniref:beta-ketoacyl-ACP synthase III n=1 Tax=unclassified Streptomyces TaxID=2593676 RepID=UPI000F6E1D71|nr:MULTISPECIES: beta-ketoacyl-ACP synthase III [unclassified Streptomyces]AZM60900.1 3-oxoacyl-ACP synthase [Streptomyces sp. WAC 01438]RSM94533.1 3-oxoacyl-ACP synthase [Streptomyces sp. WAC 01420]
MSRAAVLAGLGSHLPPRLVTNEELVSRLDTSDEWIRTRTGIRQRHVATDGLLTSDLAAGAGALALKSAGLSRADAVLLATTTPDRPCPATAPLVAEKLGLGHIPAFDVSAVCTGFLYALATASGLIAAGTVDTVLVIGAETFTRILDPAERTTSVVFGDGAGAVLVRAGDPAEPGALGPLVLGSDGSGQDLITVPRGGPPSAGETAADGYYFTMQGKKVFRLAVQRMAESIRAALDQAGWRIEDVDRFVGHQANHRILLRLADEIGLPRERGYNHIAEVGNTAAASLPLALDHAHAEGALRPGDRVLLAAFGGGLTWGATTLIWPGIDRV